MTNEQRTAWLESRRTGIGGSDVAAVLGLNPWKTPLDVWNDKLGISEDKEMLWSVRPDTAEKLSKVKLIDPTPMIDHLAYLIQKSKDEDE